MGMVLRCGLKCRHCPVNPAITNSSNRRLRIHWSEWGLISPKNIGKRNIMNHLKTLVMISLHQGFSNFFVRDPRSWFCFTLRHSSFFWHGLSFGKVWQLFFKSLRPWKGPRPLVLEPLYYMNVLIIQFIIIFVAYLLIWRRP